MSKRYYIFYLIILVLFLLQSNPVFQLDWFGFKPALALYFTLALYFYHPKNILGPLLVLCLLFELSSTVFLGFFTINLFLIFAVLFYLDKKIPEFKWIITAPALIASRIFQLVFIFYWRQYPWDSVLDFLVHIVLPDIILGTGLTLVFFWLINNIFSRNHNQLSFDK